MRYDRTRPCSDCPFRKTGGVRLTQARVLEISGIMLAGGPGDFVCHKTTGVAGTDEPSTRTELQHCAGALIFAEKHNTPTQLMRIVERLGLYDPRPLADPGLTSLVFDSQDDMLATAVDRPRPRHPRPRRRRQP